MLDWSCRRPRRRRTKLLAINFLPLITTITLFFGASATAKDETKFVEEAIHKLLKARRVLKYSYVYGYYLDGPPYRKIVFEFMQVSSEFVPPILLWI